MINAADFGGAVRIERLKKAITQFQLAQDLVNNYGFKKIEDALNLILEVESGELIPDSDTVLILTLALGVRSYTTEYNPLFKAWKEYHLYDAGQKVEIDLALAIEKIKKMHKWLNG